jgi:hypothetical protein
MPMLSHQPSPKLGYYLAVDPSQQDVRCAGGTCVHAVHAVHAAGEGTATMGCVPGSGHSAVCHSLLPHCAADVALYTDRYTQSLHSHLNTVGFLMPRIQARTMNCQGGTALAAAVAAGAKAKVQCDHTPVQPWLPSRRKIPCGDTFACC